GHLLCSLTACAEPREDFHMRAQVGKHRDGGTWARRFHAVQRRACTVDVEPIAGDSNRTDADMVGNRTDVSVHPPLRIPRAVGEFQAFFPAPWLNLRAQGTPASRVETV